MAPEYTEVYEGMFDTFNRQLEYELWPYNPIARKGGGRTGVWFFKVVDGLKKYKQEITRLYFDLEKGPELVSTALNHLKTLTERVALAAPVPDDFGDRDSMEVHKGMVRYPCRNFLIRALYVAYFGGRVATKGNIYHLALAALYVFSKKSEMVYILKRIGWGDMVSRLGEVL